jgi:hypothetical protein
VRDHNVAACGNLSNVPGHDPRRVVRRGHEVQSSNEKNSDWFLQIEQAPDITASQNILRVAKIVPDRECIRVADEILAVTGYSHRFVVNGNDPRVCATPPGDLPHATRHRNSSAEIEELANAIDGQVGDSSPQEVTVVLHAVANSGKDFHGGAGKVTVCGEVLRTACICVVYAGHVR